MNIETLRLFAPALSALVVLALIKLILGTRFGKLIQDIPNHRSMHARPIPRSGGVAVMIGIFAGWQLGVIWFQISSPVIPGSVWQNVAALVATIVMVVIALVIERICRITEDANDSEAASQGEALA